MRSLNEIVQCLPDILVTVSPSICPPKLTNPQPPPYVLVCPLLLNYKRERSADAITIDVTRAFHDFEMHCKELNIWLLGGIHRLVCFLLLYFNFLEIYVLWFWFGFPSASKVVSSMIWFILFVIEAVMQNREVRLILIWLFINIQHLFLFTVESFLIPLFPDLHLINITFYKTKAVIAVFSICIYHGPSAQAISQWGRGKTHDICIYTEEIWGQYAPLPDTFPSAEWFCVPIHHILASCLT